MNQMISSKGALIALVIAAAAAGFVIWQQMQDVAPVSELTNKKVENGNARKFVSEDYAIQFNVPEGWVVDTGADDGGDPGFALETLEVQKHREDTQKKCEQGILNAETCNYPILPLITFVPYQNATGRYFVEQKNIGGTLYYVYEEEGLYGTYVTYETTFSDRVYAFTYSEYGSQKYDLRQELENILSTVEFIPGIPLPEVKFSPITDYRLLAEFELVQNMTSEATAWFTQSINVRNTWPNEFDFPNKYFQRDRDNDGNIDPMDENGYLHIIPDWGGEPVELGKRQYSFYRYLKDCKTKITVERQEVLTTLGYGGEQIGDNFQSHCFDGSFDTYYVDSYQKLE